MTAHDIIDHYTQTNLMDRIRAALADAGFDAERPSVEDLSQLDHLHGGGLATTIAQARVADIPRGAALLDAGCGIGGPSRYLAAAYDCRVEAIDLTPDYVETAKALNEMTDLGGRIAVQVASVTDLPFEDGRFDVVWSQNVTMNVEDKPGMFAEALRVLRPGGTFTFSHLAEGPEGPPDYPMPWAMQAEASFLGTPDDILGLLEDTGFTHVADMAEAAKASPGGGPTPGTIGSAAAMGDDMPERSDRAARAMAEGRLVGMIVTARKPYE